jgi:hypothetical protein
MWSSDEGRDAVALMVLVTIFAPVGIIIKGSKAFSGGRDTDYED